MRGICVSSIAPSRIRCDHDRRLEQVAPELREDAALRHRVERVACTADPLQPPRDRLRRLDLDDEVHGTHVDAELERGGGDEARDLTLLQELLDLDPLLSRERAVVGPGDRLAPRARSGERRAARRGGGC